ncbi:MAG: hypothetical protein AB1489_15575 [Acidobacteriota bacterium]
MAKHILDELEPFDPQGEGKDTEGGNQYDKKDKDKTVCRVTTLEDYSGETPIPGSLRSFIEASGKRIIVFDVHGEIRLKKLLKITNGHVTIDGSSAPSLGVCIRDYPVKVTADQVILRYLRLRLGVSQCVELGKNGDCLDVQDCKNVVLDHLSLSWSIDELLGTDGINNVTVQWCILSEALSQSCHPEGEHSKAALLSVAKDGKLSLHHNLFAHNRDRNPRLNTGSLDIHYNVFYNYGKSYPGLSSENHGAKANYIRNYVKRGFDSQDYGFFDIRHEDVRMYIANNKMEGNEKGTKDNLLLVHQTGKHNIVDEPFNFEHVSGENNPDDVLKQVLRHAGATAPKRDSVDERIVNDVVNGTGQIIDNPEEVGGYPNY